MITPAAAARPSRLPRLLAVTGLACLVLAGLLLWRVYSAPSFHYDPGFFRDPGYQAAMRTAQLRQYPRAAAEFARVADCHPRSSLAAWSRYQEAICYRAASQTEAARRVFQAVATTYPEVHVSALARQAIEEMELSPGSASSPPRDRGSSARSPDPHC